MSVPAAFGGSVPKTYHEFLGPMIFADYAKDMVKRLPLKPGSRVLELACGTGIVTKDIAAALPDGATLHATDLTEGMLKVCREKVADDSRVTFQAMDACELTMGDASFDLIACQYGLMFFPDKVKAMRHARRVLKPGGKYVFNVWDSLAHNPIPRTVHETLAEKFASNPIPFLTKFPFSYSDRAEIERVVREGGFKECVIETVAFPSSAPTADDAARAWCEGTPILPAMAERGVTDPTPVRQEIAKVLAERFGAKPCTSTMQAIVVTAS